MPLDNTWWDPAGPFADNSAGGITAGTMRTFAKEIADHGVPGSWFNIMFGPTPITPLDWALVHASKVLWLAKTPEFEHSVDWTYGKDPSLRDAFTYTPPGVVSVQVTFSPSIVAVYNTVPGTAVAPVLSVTVDKVVEPDDTNTHVVGPTSYTTGSDDYIDIGGWAAALLADDERVIRFGLRFTPMGESPINDGSAEFFVDPTGVGAATISRPLAPAA